MSDKYSNETRCPSPDGRENPFVPGFGTKDLEGQQEIAPYYTHKRKGSTFTLNL